jgi:hypothetical protein
MATKCARGTKKEEPREVNIDTLIERFKKIRALNCNDPHDVGLDGYVWRKFILTTRAHLVARMF